jgi:hypothetical protein
VGSVQRRRWVIAVPADYGSGPGIHA